MEQLIDQSILLERNVGNLYLLFYKRLAQDKAFWLQMMVDEREHEALLKAAQAAVGSSDNFPADLLSDKLETISQTNQRILGLHDQYQKDPPSRQEAFRVALDLEKMAGEIHFNEAMHKDLAGGLVKTLQKLVHDDNAHYEKIANYMKEVGLEPGA